MFTRLGVAALSTLLVVGGVEAAPRGGGSSGGHGGGHTGGGNTGGGSTSRGSSTGGRRIVPGPYGFGAGSSNNYGSGAYYGMNTGRYGRYGYGSGGYGMVGYGGLGVPLIYGTGYGYPAPVAEDMPPVPPPPPPIGPPPYAATSPAAGPGTIAFTVPENALVWVNRDLLAQTGTDRAFTTPALSAGSLGSFSVRVTWTENGQEKSFTQRVIVRAGGRSSVMVFGRSDEKK